MNQFISFSDKFISQYRGKQPNWGFSGLGYVVYKRCVDIATLVLCDDLTWKPAGELKEGQGIIGFDPEPIYVYRTNKRYVRKGRVLYNKIEEADCVGIELEDGEIIYSTPDHKWLVRLLDDTTVRWKESKDLGKTKKGNPVYLIRPYGKPWVADNSFEGGFLSGAYDGEGNLDRLNSVQFTQVGNKTLEKVEEILQLKGVEFTKAIKSDGTTYKYRDTRQVCYSLRTHNIKNLLRFLGIFRPPRLLEKFKDNLEKRTNEIRGTELRCHPNDYVKVKRVFDAGKRKVAVLSTDIETHFTGGFASHNTYARPIEGRTEEWFETVKRCIEGAQEIGAKYTQDEAERLYDHVFNLRCTFAGRALWQLGTDTVRKLGANSLINCFFTNVTKPSDFLFIFENLMLGGGVGFSVRKEHVYEFPAVKEGVVIEHKNTKDADFIVPDSREGWIALLREVYNSYFYTGKSFSYSTILVRGKGESIKTFGGVAAGPAVLVDGVTDMCGVLSGRSGKKLRSIDVLDICNLIGQIVVSGNVRRSAEIALGDVDDTLFLKAKRWDTGKIPNWRSMSNNTVECNDFEDLQPLFWEGYKGNGEPYGLFNLKNSKKYGRIGEEMFDATGEGLNPCGEIVALADKETCNLGEIFMNNISDVKTFEDCAILLYKYQKAVCNMKYIHPETTAIVHKNNRIGVGVTGVLQNQKAMGENWYDKVYKSLRKFDKQWSKKNHYPISIRLTTIKPSGSVSLLAGASPGIHPAYSQFYIRRVEMSSNDKLVEYCRNLGFKVEYRKMLDGTDDRLTVKVEFPSRVTSETVTSDKVTAVELLDYVKFMQKNWADNSVSVTCYYKPEELKAIQKWLEDNYNENVKTLSFLLHSEHGFVQPPYEPVDEDRYNELRKDIKPIVAVTENTFVMDLLSEECESGSCPIR